MDTSIAWMSTPTSSQPFATLRNVLRDFRKTSIGTIVPESHLRSEAKASFGKFLSPGTSGILASTKHPGSAGYIPAHTPLECTAEHIVLRSQSNAHAVQIYRFFHTTKDACSSI